MPCQPIRMPSCNYIIRMEVLLVSPIQPLGTHLPVKNTLRRLAMGVSRHAMIIAKCMYSVYLPLRPELSEGIKGISQNCASSRRRFKVDLILSLGRMQPQV